MVNTFVVDSNTTLGSGKFTKPLKLSEKIIHERNIC